MKLPRSECGILPPYILRGRRTAPLFDAAVLLAAVLVVLFHAEVIGAVVFTILIASLMVLSDRIVDYLLPLLLLCVFLTRCYDSFDRFIVFLPLAVPVGLAILFHIVYYRKKPRIGSTFPGVCAVAFAVTFGGLGTISTADYFRPMALYYIVGLGAAMIGIYLLASSRIDEEDTKRIARDLYLVGALASFCVLRFYVADWDKFIETKQCLSFQSSNNLATFLMMAFPFPFYFATKRAVHLLAVPVFALCLILCGSRGGLLMGTLEILILLAVYAFAYRKQLLNRVLCTFALAATLLAIYRYFPAVLRFCHISTDSVSKDTTIVGYLKSILESTVQREESRYQLIGRAVDCFKRNPVFGSGLTYTGNSDLYNPLKGAMNWYHMWLPQIVGSMGTVGIAAYLCQLFLRGRALFRNRSMIHLTLAMSYVGLLLMSQVNPGEFCPIPYAVLPVLFFLLMDGKKKA